MKINHYAGVAIACLVLLSLTVADAQKTLSKEQTAIETKLRALDAEWSAAAAAKDVDKTVSYYSDDAIVLPPNAVAARTKEAVRAQWKGDLDSLIKGSWTPTRVEVAKSGDMAYVSGTYEWTYKDASGKVINDTGKYLEVWEKQADGSWKCGADAWNSDLALPKG
jgi:ketosteroid isomerase-like protein